MRSPLEDPALPSEIVVHKDEPDWDYSLPIRGHGNREFPTDARSRNEDDDDQRNRDGHTTIEDEKHSLRFRASLLLCRSVRPDNEGLHVSRPVAERHFATETPHRKETDRFDCHMFNPFLKEGQIEKETLKKVEHEVKMKSDKIFDEFVVERHVETYPSRSSKDKNRTEDEISFVNPFVTDSRLEPGRLPRIEEYEDNLSSPPKDLPLVIDVIEFPKDKLPPRPKKASRLKTRGRQHDRRNTRSLRLISVLDMDGDDVSAVTEDIILHPSDIGCSVMQWQDPGVNGLEGCLGLSLLPLMRAPTPPRRQSSDSETTPPKYTMGEAKLDKESPKSVAGETFFISDFASTSNHTSPRRVRRRKARKRTKSPLQQAGEILADLEKGLRPDLFELHQAQKTTKTWASAKGPRCRDRVSFAKPLVTAVNFRPFTKPEEIPLLFFNPEELLTLERDRKSRILEEQFECVATPSGEHFHVSITFPKRLSQKTVSVRHSSEGSTLCEV